MAERQMQAMALVVHQMICDGELFNSKKLSKITVIVRTFFKKISFILYIKYINPSSRLRIFMSVINFVHKMSPLFGVYYRFCARNVLTFFLHFIFGAQNVLTFCVHFILPHFVPGNFRWPTVSVANTPSLLERRKPSKEAGRRPAILRVLIITFNIFFRKNTSNWIWSIQRNPNVKKIRLWLKSTKSLLMVWNQWPLTKRIKRS